MLWSPVEINLPEIKNERRSHQLHFHDHPFIAVADQFGHGKSADGFDPGRAEPLITLQLLAIIALTLKGFDGRLLAGVPNSSVLSMP
jgi:hypothetical protein